ncbi:MAG TPA: carboxypeptidase regulatory-like domain-containing protein [Candidatus Angelobacter sp.]|nr:carboxypeptidase regulatory-like domain-containing protein [Candidatus Angelobacter sp.]
MPACFLLLAVAVRAQTPVSVGYQKQIQINVSGASAAYSLDSSIAEASASAGVVEITGKAPGSTNIVVVTPAGVQSMAVVVPQPPTVLPPGFEPPGKEGATGETGSYEVRYNSDPGQITNSLDMKRAQGSDSFERLRMVNANLLSTGSSQSQSMVGFPFLSYEIARTNRDLTFVDQNVVNSPFTLDNDLVRGFHMRQGPWLFHGGFTSIATFQGLFLSTDREYVAGVSRMFVRDDNSSLEANLYYFCNPAGAQLVSSNGAMGSLVYRINRGDRIHFLTEVGVSRGVGFAVRGSYDTERDHLLGSFHTESPKFASLAVNPQHGTFTAIDATRKLKPRLYDAFDLSQSEYDLPALQQKTLTMGDQVQFKLNRSLSLNSGISYSSFSSTVPVGPSITTTNLPVGADYSARHFGAGVEYQRTFATGGAGGNDYAVNLRGSAGQFHGGVFFRHDVQVPTVTTVFSQIPGLQDALERAGIVATTPDQLAGLLNSAALLSSLGFTTPLVVNLAPSRNDLEASLSWMSRGRTRRTADLTWFKSDTELIQGKLTLSTITLSYAQNVGVNNKIVASAAMVRNDSNGVATTKPLVSVTLQHRFFTVPGMLFPGRHGMIEGYVFRDDDSASYYSSQPRLAGVEVRLDDDRVTHTNADGYYAFHHVTYGVHRVEARYQSDEPFFYTTDSPATTDINTWVDFGINFAKGQIFGYLKNDAGAGVSGVTVELKENERVRQTQTGDNGKFSFAGLSPGNYTVSTVAASYPTGYSLADLAPQTVSVLPTRPASVAFAVKALRSVSGKVLVFDQQAMKTVPLAGAVMRLKELSLEARTGETGAYIFRNLPAGTYTLVVEHQGKEFTRSVTLPAGPTSLRDVDLNAGAR